MLFFLQQSAPQCRVINLTFFPFFHRWVFVVGQGQWGIKKRKNVKATICRELKQFPRWCPVTFRAFVKTWLKAEMVKVNLKLHPEVNFLSEKQKHHNCTTYASKRKRLFSWFALLQRGTVSQIVIYCSGVCQLGQHPPAFLKKNQTTIFIFFSFLNLFQEVHQILHSTRHDQIECTGYILSLSQMLLRLSRANMQARAHMHMQLCTQSQMLLSILPLYHLEFLHISQILWMRTEVI